MARSHHLGELQYAIMRVLWRLGEASVAQVLQELPEDDRRAVTTIATMLTKMERKGVVSHRAEGRTFLYRPEVSEVEVRRDMLAALTERLFQGDVAELVSHLIREGEVDASELARLEALIARRQREEERA